MPMWPVGACRLPMGVDGMEFWSFELGAMTFICDPPPPTGIGFFFGHLPTTFKSKTCLSECLNRMTFYRHRSTHVGDVHLFSDVRTDDAGHLYEATEAGHRPFRLFPVLNQNATCKCGVSCF